MSVTGTCPPPDGAQDIVCIWWRNGHDAPDLPPHRMAPRTRDEDVTLISRAGEDR